MKRAGTRIILTAVLFLSVLSLDNVFASASSGFKGGQEMPLASDFSLPTVAGSTVALKDFKGKGVILFFFTTWCPYCRHTLPVLAKNYQEYQNQGFELLVIDAGESKPKVSSFIAKESFPFDILLDGDTTVAEAYNVVGVPTFVLVSKQGRIVYSGNDMPAHYKELLEQ